MKIKFSVKNFLMRCSLFSLRGGALIITSLIFFFQIDQCLAKNLDDFSKTKSTKTYLYTSQTTDLTYFKIIKLGSNFHSIKEWSAYGPFLAASKNGFILNHYTGGNWALHLFNSDGAKISDWEAYKPYTFAFDTKGFAYVVDYSPIPPVVFKYDLSGHIIDTWGKEKIPWSIYNIVVDKHNVIYLFVLDMIEGRLVCKIARYSDTGNFIGFFGDETIAHLPVGIAFDSRGNSYVLENETDLKVFKFDQKGKFVNSFLVRKSTSPYPNEPEPGWIAVDDTDNLFVLAHIDNEESVIYKYSSDGKLIDSYKNKSYIASMVSAPV